MGDELQPCAACGGCDMLEIDGGAVHCTRCGVWGPHWTYTSQYIDAWNAIPRKSDIAKAVAAERARVKAKAAEIVRCRMFSMDSSYDDILRDLEAIT